jgi:hypothetical protein
MNFSRLFLRPQKVISESAARLMTELYIIGVILFYYEVNYIANCLVM